MVRDTKFLQELLDAYYVSPKYRRPQDAERAFQLDMKYLSKNTRPDTPENREIVIDQVKKGFVKDDIEGQDIPLTEDDGPLFLVRHDGSTLKIRPTKGMTSYDKQRRVEAGRQAWVNYLKKLESQGKTVKYPEYYKKSLSSIQSEQKEPESPATKSVTEPVTESESPVAEPEQKEPESPVAEPEPESPVAEPESPVAEPESPVAEPESPVAEPESPVAEPEQKEPESPVAEPESPVAEPEQKEPESPVVEPVKKQEIGIEVTPGVGIFVIENGVKRKLLEEEDVSDLPEDIIQRLKSNKNVNFEEDDDGFMFVSLKPTDHTVRTGSVEDFIEDDLDDVKTADELTTSDKLEEFMDSMGDGDYDFEDAFVEADDEDNAKEAPRDKLLRSLDEISQMEQPESPVAEPESPVEEPESPVAEPESPVEEPESPVAEPESPVEEPESPVAEPESPVAEPESPVAEPESPVAEPESPVEEPESPVAEPESPVAEPESPVAEPESPVAEPESPVAEPEEEEDDLMSNLEDIDNLVNFYDSGIFMGGKPEYYVETVDLDGNPVLQLVSDLIDGIDEYTDIDQAENLKKVTNEQTIKSLKKQIKDAFE